MPNPHVLSEEKEIPHSPDINFALGPKAIGVAVATVQLAPNRTGAIKQTQQT